MAKPIYCSLLLLVVCFIYKTYGSHLVRHETLPSRRTSEDNGPYDSSSPLSSLSTAKVEDNEEVADAETTSVSQSSPLKKSFRLINSLDNDRNRGLGLNRKTQHNIYHTQQPNFMDSDNFNNENMQNSMNSGFLNNKHPSGLYNRNENIYTNSEDQNIGKRQNNMNSNFQDFPNLNTMNSFNMRIARQNSLSPSYNDDDIQRIRVGNKPFNPIFTTFSNVDNGLSNMMTQLMGKQFKPFGQNLFNSPWGNMGDFQKTEKPTNMRLGSIRFSTIIPSIGSSSGMGPNAIMPQKRKPINYPYSDPIGLSEDKANEIRNQVLEKSNFYREKYNLDSFTLEDQLNNCAQDWANQMAKSNTFNHRQNNAYGENLYSSTDINNLGEKAVEAWYNEILQFDIADDESGLSSNTPTHHMTQLLWKSSNKLGVGVSKSPNGMYNVVANYDPSGNVIGFFKNNLPDIKQEDIEEAKESQNSQTEMEQDPETNWSSNSISPKQSNWNYNPYYN